MTAHNLIHYRIIDQIGYGGMGAVYKAYDTRLLRHVAIKLLRPELMVDQSKRRRFIKEAQTASSLNHPNICTIHDINEDGDQHFIVMELVEGETLREILDKRGKIPEAELTNIAIKICEALAVVHKKGISHRDIKPENIMITNNGLVKVMDFGLAKLATEYAESMVEMEASENWPSDYVDKVVVTNLSGLLGTVYYMSPEQAQGNEIDQRSDIFSLGIMLCELLTGHKPFDGDSNLDILTKIIKAPSELDFHSIDVSPEFKSILSRALEKEADNRYQSVNELVEDLIQLKGGDSTSSVPEREPKTATTTARKKPVKSILLFSALAITLIATLLFLLLSNEEPADDLPPMRTVRITSYPGEEYYPALSPDGQSIAFTWNGPERDNFDIYTKKIDGGEPVRLTRSPFNDTQPEWSPDSQSIAFIREYPLNPLWTPKEIFIIPAVGGQEKSISNFSPGAYERSSICWSGDAKFIFYTSWDHKDNGWFTIYKVSVETKQSQLLPTYQSGINEYSPRISPDGKYFLFYHGEIGILDMAAKESRFITDLNLPFRGYAWLNDSRSIIFAANLDGTSALWKTDISGKKPTKVLSGININNPSISGDGKRLAYAETIQSSSIWKVDLKEPQNETLLIRSSELKNGDPDISPDGRKILFYSNRTGTGNIWICNSDGSNPEQLTFFEKPGNVNAVWSPSGSKILIKNKQGSFVLNITGGKPKLISDHTRISSWAKDDSGFYSYDRKPNVFYLSADKSRKEPITKERGCFPVYHNKYVYYLKEYYKHDIWRVPAQGGREEPVIEGLSGLGRRNWTVGQKGIYFVQEAEGSFFLKMYDFKSKQIRPIKELPMITPSPYSTIDVAPDDSYLLYTRHENKSDIILVKNFRIE